jgi:phosphoenolpyruvate carboxykinase (GTP)
VPIDAFLFGGRRSTVVPLVTEARDWEHGTFLGATMSSETTAAAAGQVGKLRFDPMAMLPFCGYNMAGYFAHWLKLGRREGAVLPRIYYVNWFRKDDGGKFIWPGFGENSRVLAWIFRRCEGTADGADSVLGIVPTADSLETNGLDLDAAALEQLLTVDPDAMRQQLPQVREHLARFGDDLPAEIRAQFEELERRLA